MPLQKAKCINGLLFDEDIHVESEFLTQFRAVSKKFLDLRDYDSLKYIYELEAAKTVKLPLRSVIPSVDRGYCVV